MKSIQERTLMTCERWERMWSSYVNAIAACDGMTRQNSTRHQRIAAQLRLAKAAKAIQEHDLRFAKAVGVSRYWTKPDEGSP